MPKPIVKKFGTGIKTLNFLPSDYRTIKMVGNCETSFIKTVAAQNPIHTSKTINKQLIILEGMFDLLSLATLDERLLKASDIMVLNSIAFIKDMETYIKNYESVYLYLDNDTAGKNATKYLIGQV